MLVSLCCFVHVRPAPPVLGREHEHLVDPRCGCLGEDRAPVAHHEGVQPREGRIEVRHDPHGPLAALGVGHQGRRCAFLVARAERTGTGGVELHRKQPSGEGVRAGGPLLGHRHPPSGEGVKSKLAHRFLLPGSLRVAGSLDPVKAASWPLGAPSVVSLTTR